MKKQEHPSSTSADADDEPFDLEAIPPEVYAAIHALLRAFAKAQRHSATSPASITAPVETNNPPER